MIATHLWDRHRAVKALQFAAHSNAATGWNGTGSGSVTVEVVDARTLLFHESGSWQPATGRILHFTNVFRWTVLDVPDQLRLEHLRFGARHPVFLFDLAPVAAAEWQSVSPHVCRDDCYSAGLRVLESRIELFWAVSGPTKQVEIRYDYLDTREAPDITTPPPI